ncbi:hypothetical protein ACTFIY_003339 [Dictyostelium cf. discoideum]
MRDYYGNFHNDPWLEILPYGIGEIEFCNNSCMLSNRNENTIPSSFGNNYNEIIQNGVIPNGIRSIKFGSSYNQPLKIGIFPPTITSIQFGSLFNQPIQDINNYQIH